MSGSCRDQASSLQRLRQALGACTLVGLVLLAVCGWLTWTAGTSVAGLLTTLTVYLLGVGCLLRQLAWHRSSSGEVLPRFGAANGVTLLRLAMVAWLAGQLAGRGGDPDWPNVALAVSALLLDGVDGWLARRSGLASEFGARFDMETDALAVLVLSALIWHAGVTGPWVMLSGLMRYLYLAAGWWLPWLSAPLPFSWRRKTVCVVQIACLIVALTPGLQASSGALVAGIGLLALIYSFAADIWWLAAHRQRLHVA